MRRDEERSTKLFYQLDTGGYLEEKKQSFEDYKNEKKTERIFCRFNNKHNNEKQHLRKQKSPDYQNGPRRTP